jgi:HEAT repeat protein
MSKNEKTAENTSQKAAEISRKVAKRSARETRKAIRRFGSLTLDVTRSLVGVGQRRVNRRSNRTATGRYINDIITVAETSHLAGLHTDLSKILIEPRFIAIQDVIEPTAEDDVNQEVFHVIPQIPDMPYIMAPYNIPSFRIPELAEGHRKLLIVGPSGSGRTTALMAIALWVVQEIEFTEKDDPVKTQLAEEEAALTERERQERERQREEAREAAKEQLEIAIASGEVQAKGKAGPVNREEAFLADQADEDEIPLPPFSSLLPLFINCVDLNITVSEFGSEVDPAEPLVRAVQRRVSTLSARTIPHVIYKRLEQNQTLILMDGYDDLSASEKLNVEAWLRAFDEEYGKNFIIMTGPAIGYGKLVNMGMAPLMVKPWNVEETSDYINKWSEVWPQVNGTRRKPGEAVGKMRMKRAAIDSYALSPAEMTLKLWASFSEEEARLHLDEWVQVFLEKHLPQNQSFEEALPILKIAAALQTDQGFIRQRGVETIIAQQESAGTANISSVSLQEVDDETKDTESTTTDDDDLDDEIADDEASLRRQRLLNELVFSGMLVRYRGGRLRFRHQLISDYLASLTLTPLPEEDPETLFDLAQRPNWQRPLRLAVLHTDMDDVVRMRLSAHEDVMRNHLTMMARWLAMAKDDPAWRNEILSRLGNAFVHPEQFLANRERIAAALVESRDPAGAMQIFQVGLTHPNGDVRRLSCLGVGAMGTHGHPYVKLLSDCSDAREEDVRVAAAHALTAIYTPDAQDTLVDAFLHGDERLQQAIAEEFAGMRNTGLPTLYDAVHHEEMKVRRATLFGIRRIETDWAHEVIRQTFLTEDEWFVRVVAQEAFLDHQAGITGPTAPREPSELEWVQEWAAARHKKLPIGPASRDLLTDTLQDHNPDIRALGAITLGQLGAAQAIEGLYERLRDPEFHVREAAHKGLTELQIRMGNALPDPR